jgi:hypothetical protein
MTKSFEVVFSRPATQTLVLKIAANNQDEARQKAWEALLVDEHENHLPWRQMGSAGNVSLDSTRTTS